jgi:alginate O-acetyltransferase complex protein AlgI
MSFTSIHFLIFFPVVTRLYFIVPYRMRWALLVAASYYFYMSWRPWYALLLLFATAVSFVCGLLIAGEDDLKRRRAWLIAGCAINLAVLFVFKYFDFFNTQTRDLMAAIGVDYNIPNLDLVLPVAISFHTFQVLSYLFDVYRRDVAPERHFGIFSLYVVYYPQLVAGPIERAFHFLPQLRKLLTPAPELAYDESRAISGFRLILSGFVKKLVVADNLALYVDPIYNHPADASGGALALATIAFAFQIYFDFSAYTDIARGCSRVMGIELIENFRRPYLARSVAEFWKRWHISLTSWFRDYVYFPMGGNRVSHGRWIVNVMAVFLMSGLWHGANWTFVVWGLLHGGYYVVSRNTAVWRAAFAARIGLLGRSGWHAAWQTLATFALVCFAWVFFRASDMTAALTIVSSIAESAAQPFAQLFGAAPLVSVAKMTLATFNEPRFYFALAALALFALWEIRREYRDIDFAQLAVWQRWSVYYAACLAIVVIGNMGNKQFIYFQF